MNSDRLPASVRVLDFMTYDELVQHNRDHCTYDREQHPDMPEVLAANYLMLTDRRHDLPPAHPGYSADRP